MLELGANPGPVTDEGVHENGKKADGSEDARMDARSECVCVWDVDAVCEDLSEVAERAGAAQLSPDTPLSRSPFAFSSRRLFDQPLI